MNPSLTSPTPDTDHDRPLEPPPALPTETLDLSIIAPLNALESPSLIHNAPKRRSWVWLPALALFPLGFFLFPRLFPAPEPTASPTVLPVQVETLEQIAHYSVTREYSGEIVPGRQSEIGFERSGTVVKILVDEGDRVTEGQVLAQLDRRSLDSQRQGLLAQLAQAQAQLQELEAGPRSEQIAAARATVTDLEQQLTLAQLRRDRRQELYEVGAISQEELNQETYATGSLESRLAAARSQVQELENGTRSEQLAAQSAQLKAIQAQIHSLDIEISKSELRAPFTGIVAQRRLDEGTVTAAGTPVLSVLEAATWEARIGIPPDRASLLNSNSGEQALNSSENLNFSELNSITVQNQEYPAVLQALLPNLDPTSQTLTAVFQLQPTPQLPPLQSGQTARLTLTETQSVTGFWLPSTALVPADRGLWSIYSLGTEVPSQEISKNLPENSPEGPSERYSVDRHLVEVLHSVGDRSVVRGTVTAGDQIIISGTHRLVPGQLVEISTEAPAESGGKTY